MDVERINRSESNEPGKGDLTSKEDEFSFLELEERLEMEAAPPVDSPIEWRVDWYF
ncbi:MAG: hypothetical protein H0Z29_11925 [Candidatus Marinimicrobia bacterium]|nr:hypothetical protein [Candidatus Neomarinimicrobiota bacterium]